jgi:hypothetical protein
MTLIEAIYRHHNYTPISNGGFRNKMRVDPQFFYRFFRRRGLFNASVVAFIILCGSVWLFILNSALKPPILFVKFAPEELWKKVRV